MNTIGRMGRKPVIMMQAAPAGCFIVRVISDGVELHRTAPLTLAAAERAKASYLGSVQS